MPLQIRRGTEAERQVLATAPQDGELIWITDEQRMYVGDGATLLRDLSPITGYTDENARDAAANAITNGTHSGVTFVYDDAADTISATVSYPALLQDLDLNSNNIIGSGNISFTGNLTVDGNITGDYKGSIFADDSSLMIDSVTGTFNLDGKVQNHIVPINTDTAEIGSVSNKFKEIYLSDNVWIGNAGIGTNGVGINLPAGSTIDGNPINEGGVGGQLQIDIIGADSTVIINTETNTVSGNLVGDLNGSVFGDDSSILVDAIDSRIVGRIDTEIQPTFAYDNTGDPTIDTTATFLSVTNGVDGAFVDFDAAKGTLGNLQSIGTGEFTGGFRLRSYNGTDYQSAVTFYGETTASATFTSNPDTEFNIFVGNNTGMTPFKFIGSTGSFETNILKLNVYANDTARDAAITSPEQGMFIFNQRDDSTGVPVFQGYDGATWVDLH